MVVCGVGVVFLCGRYDLLVLLRCSLFVACCMSCVVWCAMFGVRGCSLGVVSWASFVACGLIRCLLFVGCCLPCVCCMMCVVSCL